MPNLNYIYEKTIAAGALEEVVLAPVKNNSLQDRVGKVLPYFFAIPEDYFPCDLREELSTIKSVCDHPIKPSIHWPPDSVGRRVRSLSSKEAKEVLQAFLTLTVEVLKQLDPNSKWRRIKHNARVPSR